MIEIKYTITSPIPFPDAKFEPKFSTAEMTEDACTEWCFANGLLGAKVNMVSPTVKECIATWSSQALIDAFTAKIPGYQTLLTNYLASRESGGCTVVRTVTTI